MSNLERAIALAALAHEGQIDKGGRPYILHPLAVMARVQDPVDRIVAVLHDVVEDCDVTFERLRQEGFSDEVVGAVDALTKRDGEGYMAAIRRASANPIARRVKLADLEDNRDLSRIPNPQQRDFDRIEKYNRATQFLESA